MAQIIMVYLDPCKTDIPKEDYDGLWQRLLEFSEKLPKSTSMLFPHPSANLDHSAYLPCNTSLPPDFESYAADSDDEDKAYLSLLRALMLMSDEDRCIVLEIGRGFDTSGHRHSKDRLINLSTVDLYIYDDFTGPHSDALLEEIRAAFESDRSRISDRDSMREYLRIQRVKKERGFSRGSYRTLGVYAPPRDLEREMREERERELLRKTYGLLTKESDIPRRSDGSFDISLVAYRVGSTVDELSGIDWRGMVSIDGDRIRSYSGHEFPVEYPSGDIPDTLYYWTNENELVCIMAEGELLSDDHYMVHMFAETPRTNRGLCVSIDAKAMIEDGHRIFVSGDGYYLSRSVPSRYFSRYVDTNLESSLDRNIWLDAPFFDRLCSGEISAVSLPRDCYYWMLGKGDTIHFNSEAGNVTCRIVEVRDDDGSAVALSIGPGCS